MKSLIAGILKILMRIDYALMRMFPVQNKVTMLSRQSNSMSADFRCIESWIKNDIGAECIVLIKMIEGHTLSYPFHILRQIYHIATSRLVIIDGYCIAASCLHLRNETQVMQIWHASTAVKKFGWQTVGKPSGSSREIAEALHMHDNYDIVIAPSKATARFYSEAMKTDISRFRYIALPHVSEMVSLDSDDISEIRKRLGVSPDKRTVLYAPTFREGKPVPVDDIAEKLDFARYDLVFKPHPLDLSSAGNTDIILAGKDADIFSLIAAADIVITDYSSIIIEAAIMEKELYIYAYDLDRYKLDPGLNIDLENGNDIDKNLIFKDADGLIDALGSKYDIEAVRSFAENFFEADPANSNLGFTELISSILKV